MWGWAPTEVHTPEYDDTGRVVRVVVEREPEFDTEQYELMAALSDYEASLNEYGLPYDEVTSLDADPANRRSSYKYEADSVVDWSALAVEQHLKAKGDDDPYRAARKVRVWRVEKR